MSKDTKIKNKENEKSQLDVKQDKEYEFEHRIYLLVFLYLIRVINGHLIKYSYYYPDEYFQSVEVSHSDVWGSGYRSWEWTSAQPIRSPVYPTMFSVFYYLMDMLPLPVPLQSYLIAHGPRLYFHTFSAALMDYYTILYSLLYLNQSNKSTHSLFLAILFYSSYAGLNLPTRTLTNSLEATLLIISMFYFQLNNNNSQWKARVLISLNFMVRPTSVVVWPLLFVCKVYKHRQQLFVQLLINVGHAVSTLAICVLIDSLYYGHLTCTPYNFLDWNVIQGNSIYFSTEPYHYFITHTFPQYFSFYSYLFPLALFLFLFKQTHQIKLILAFLIYFAMISSTSHKEDRFIMGIYPIFTIILGYFFQFLYQKKQILTIFILFYLSIYQNINAFINRGMFKDQGSIYLADYLRTLDKKIKTAVIFYGCYNSPLNSIVHKNMYIDIANCLPNQSEDILYQEQFTFEYLDLKVKKWEPEVVVMENKYLKLAKVTNYLKARGYHSLVQIDKHRGWHGEYYEVFYTPHH